VRAIACDETGSSATTRSLAHRTFRMDHPLTAEERHALETLGRDALRAAADAPDPTRALAWADAAAACLAVVVAADRSLRDAGRLLDRPLGDAPFAGSWKEVVTPIAARAEALLSRDVDRDVDELTDRLGRP
jgi:hypothetical protein